VTARHIRETEFAAEGVLQALQFGQLRHVLIHAYDHVPYYRDIFRRNGLDPHRFSDAAQIRDYPLLTKRIYQDNVDALVTSRIAQRLSLVAFTGGTTGTPVKLYRSLAHYGRARAYQEHAYRMMGMDPTARTVHIRGSVDDAHGIYHAVGNLGNTLYLSSNNLDEENLKRYVQLMRNFRPVLLYTLPSVAAILAEYMERHQLPPIASLRYAFLPSENLYEFQRRCIQRVFRCMIGSVYGQAENVVLASHCTFGPFYHVFPQFGYAELLDEDRRPVTEEGGRGEIVGTAFGNRVSPLIRYRTGDYAVYTRERCPCGRHYPMWREVQGREQSVAIARNGSRVSVGPELLCTLHEGAYGKIKQFHIRQEKVGQLDILVATLHRRDFGEVARFFERFFEDHFPGMFHIQVTGCTDAARLTQGGKHVYFVQRLPLDGPAMPLS
jgi:phenylacetate-CoA ligase